MENFTKKTKEFNTQHNVVPSSQTIIEQINSFVKNNELLLLIEYLRVLPLHSATDIKPNFITYNVYKTEKQHFELTCTADGWSTSRVGSKQLALLLFNKIQSSSFTWE